MPIFEEKEPSLGMALLIPLLAFMLAFPLWHIGERDLYWSEGDFAAMAKEMPAFPHITYAHGEIVPDSYPMFPLLASLLDKTGLDMEFSLRLISVLSLAGICAVVWRACRQAGGLQAAVAGCAMMLSTVLVAEKVLDGYPNMLSMLLMLSGWLLWFSFGTSAGNWNAAWTCAGFFAGMAFYTTGWEALVYFITPLLFMRRPLSIWGRLKHPGFLAGVAIVIGFILLWGLPRWKAGADIPFRSMPIAHDLHVWDYIVQLVVFPFEVMVRLLPWTIIAWAPFCAAFAPLDRNPIFSRFLRTIFLSLFFLLWFSPLTRGRDIIILAPPLAVLVGMHYWIAARRYGQQMLSVLKLASLAAMGSGAAALAFHLAPTHTIESLLPLSRDISYKASPFGLMRGASESAAAILAGFLAFLLCRTKKPVWSVMLCLFVSSMLVFWAMVNPYRASDREKSELGRTLKDAIGKAATPELTVYKDFPGLYAECYYLGCKVRKIKTVDDVPKDEAEVYVIASEVPSIPERLWTNLLHDMKYKDRRLCIWKGVLKDEGRKNAGKQDVP